MCIVREREIKSDDSNIQCFDKDFKVLCYYFGFKNNDQLSYRENDIDEPNTSRRSLLDTRNIDEQYL